MEGFAPRGETPHVFAVRDNSLLMEPMTYGVVSGQIGPRVNYARVAVGQRRRHVAEQRKMPDGCGG